MNVEEFWKSFLVNTGRPSDTPCYDCFHFELTKEVSDRLLALVLSGKKQATASSLRYYEMSGEAITECGALSIVTTFEGHPVCVIETTNVMILPFSEITYDICKREGKDDTLESWREGHEAFFRAEGEETGYTSDEQLPVVFEDFKVIYRKKPEDYDQQ